MCVGRFWFRVVVVDSSYGMDDMFDFEGTPGVG
jgi:hypothetical protein